MYICVYIYMYIYILHRYHERSIALCKPYTVCTYISLYTKSFSSIVANLHEFAESWKIDLLHHIYPYRDTVSHICIYRVCICMYINTWYIYIYKISVCVFVSIYILFFSWLVSVLGSTPRRFTGSSGVLESSDPKINWRAIAFPKALGVGWTSIEPA